MDLLHASSSVINRRCREMSETWLFVKIGRCLIAIVPNLDQNSRCLTPTSIELVLNYSVERTGVNGVGLFLPTTVGVSLIIKAWPFEEDGYLF